MSKNMLITCFVKTQIVCPYFVRQSCFREVFPPEARHSEAQKKLPGSSLARFVPAVFSGRFFSVRCFLAGMVLAIPTNFDWLKWGTSRVSGLEK